MSSTDLFICTKCFGLTSLGRGMQRCGCEEYKSYPRIDCSNGYQLCHLCAASLAGGTGRYSWNVCEACLKFNRILGSKYGASLPLGRHSIMNGLSIPVSATKEVQEEGIKQLMNFFETLQSIADWGDLQARVLFESIPTWRKETFISLDIWEAKFALSTVKATTRSVNAFKEYLQIEDFSALVGELSVPPDTFTA
jgi:hypothetical protein